MGDTPDLSGDERVAAFASRLGEVLGRIEAAAHRAGRNPEDVLLVGISKTFPLRAVLEARAAGLSHLGENRAQELRSKAAEVQDVRWHFVGRLQTNKVKLVVGTAWLIHSVDSLHLAEAIGTRARKLDLEQEILVEVNLSGEGSKSGVSPDDALELARAAEAIDGVSVRGLMSIPALPEDPEDARPDLRALRELGGELVQALPGATHLSMGMTRDFEIAVEEGATIVRVGEALFGRRPAP